MNVDTMTREFLRISGHQERISSIHSTSVALNAEGKPDFNRMQNYKSAEFLVYFVFDILMHER